MEYSQKIKELREQNFWTQEDLAKKLGTSSITISRLENSKNKPSIKTQKILHDLFVQTHVSSLGEPQFSEDYYFDVYNKLNLDSSHMKSTDDICTPMECVKLMIDYIPNDFWDRDIKVLDPCCGNGNFGAYCMFKTDIDNIWFNDLNQQRLDNCKRILNPKHISSCDFFSFSEQKWDLIMANPPYSGGGNKNQSISNQFIEHAILLLKHGGYLCFITPNNWMTYNNKNTTLKKLLNFGSFLVIDNDVHKYFPSVGSSFTVFIWQKGVYNNKTFVKNNYLIRDEKKDIIIPKNIPFIPLYISNESILLVKKMIDVKENGIFHYRCDLHNFTQKAFLQDRCEGDYVYETIHTPRITRYASKKQEDIYNKWLIIIPLSTYYVPYIRHNVNVTQSVGYMAFDTEKQAQDFLNVITKDEFKILIHLTRYGNFNNIMVLKHIKFKEIIKNKKEQQYINEIASKIKY